MVLLQSNNLTTELKRGTAFEFMCVMTCRPAADDGFDISGQLALAET
jgi:hypothetical protein